MAESLLFGIAKNILVQLGSLAYPEVCLAWGVKSDLEKLEDILSSIKAVLLDAEEKQVHDNELRVWLEKLKDACYDAEDVLDEFEVEALRSQLMKHQSIERKVCYFFSCSNPLSFPFKMGHEIKKIRERFDEIASIRAKFKLTERDDNNVSSHDMHTQKETYSFTPASSIIGRDDDKEEIIKRLMNPSDDNGQNISVIPIFGIGGLGKTALAKLVYNDERVVDHFQIKMWVCVSDDFDLKHMIIRIIKSATGENCGNMDIDQLQIKLRDTLKESKYLLVMDDVWNEDPRKWIALKDLLSSGGIKGSKVIVTTRSNRVALIMGTIPKYDLNNLPYESCLILFMKYVFKDEKNRRPNLIKISEEIVKKCRGNPLAVTTLGSLLYFSRDEHYWKLIRDNEIWELKQKEDDILPVLRLSYDRLSSDLRRCFVSCSIFPKDCEFSNVALIYFWMAQGLLQSSTNEMPEDVGKRYLNELWSRSFFQDFDPSMNLVKFKMHDLMHDLAISMAKNELFIVNSGNYNQHVSKNIRHLSFRDVDTLGNNGNDVPDHVRTISFPYHEKGPSRSFVESCISKSRFLRVLEFHSSDMEVLPRKIADRKHLRYLDLENNSKLKKLPNSICKLQSLQTLILNGCIQLKELPRDIRYLTNLRSLFFTTKQNCLPENGIGCLSSLRFLLISSCVNLESLFEDVGNLRDLQTLIIDDCPSLISLPPGIKYLSSLESLILTKCQRLNLELRMEIEGPQDNHQDQSMTMHNLQFLAIQKLEQLEEFPQWLLQCSANTLRYLYIEACPIIVLPESLQNLKSVEKLYIFDCLKLSSLPEDMHCLTSLRELAIKGCPALSQRCKAEDWPKIAHIPKVYLID